MKQISKADVVTVSAQDLVPGMIIAEGLITMVEVLPERGVVWLTTWGARQRHLVRPDTPVPVFAKAQKALVQSLHPLEST